MGLLGRLVVEITGDSTKLNKSLDTSQSKFQKFTSFAKVAAPIVGAALLGIGVAAIKAFGEQAKAEAKLTAALKATGKQATISIGSLKKYASELQKVTLYGDEVSISALALVQQFADLDEKGLKAVLPGIQDMSAALGVSLESAATLVGKTLGSTTNALSRYGIELDVNADKSDKLAQLTDQLKAKFGGTAEEIAKAGTGPLVQFKNNIGDLAETIGGILIPGMNYLLPALNALTVGLAKALTGETDLEKATSTLTTVTNTYKEAVKKLDEESATLNTTQKTLLETTKRIAQAQAIKVLVDLQKSYKQTTERIAKLKTETDSLEESQIALGKSLAYLQKTGAKGIYIRGEWFTEIQLAEEYASWLPEIQRREEQRGKLEKQLADGITAIALAIDSEALSTEQLAGSDAKLRAEILARIKEVEEEEKKADAANAIRLKDKIALTEAEVERRKQLAEELATASDDAFKKSADALDQFQQDYYTRQEEMAAAAKKKIEDLTTAIVPYVESVAKVLGDTIAAGAEGWEVFKEGAKSAISAAIEALGKQFAVQAAGYFTNPFTIPMAIALTGASVAAFAGAAFVRALAKGGVTTGPTTALIGEAGREAVLPLTNQDVMADLASQITKHMPINNIFEPTNNINFPNQLMLNIEGKQINAYITEASRNGRILIDSNRGLV